MTIFSVGPVGLDFGSEFPCNQAGGVTFHMSFAEVINDMGSDVIYVVAL